MDLIKLVYNMVVFGCMYLFFAFYRFSSDVGCYCLFSFVSYSFAATCIYFYVYSQFDVNLSYVDNYNQPIARSSVITLLDWISALVLTLLISSYYTQSIKVFIPILQDFLIWNHFQTEIVKLLFVDLIFYIFDFCAACLSSIYIYITAPSVLCILGVSIQNFFYVYFEVTAAGLLLSLLTIFLYYILVVEYLPAALVYQPKFLFSIAIGFVSLLICFNTSNFFLFYIFFEFILVPFYFIIGLWGAKINRLGAALRLVFFTVIFSLPLGIFMLVNLLADNFSFDFNILAATLVSMDPTLVSYFYISSFLAFAVKIPLFPAYVWLPEAHGEAPTFGSVLLAGILLKLGGYGFIKLFYVAPNEFTIDYGVSIFPLVYAISVITIIYSNISVFMQVDIKKTIAYYSIGHIGFVTLGLSTGTIEGYQGAITIMFAHGLSAAGLFFIVGYLYEHTHSRAIFLYRGLATVAPYFSVLFFLFICANMSLPGTINFIGEQLVLTSLAKYSPSAVLLPLIGVFLNGVSSILFANRLLFGEPSADSLLKAQDISLRETIIFSCVCAPLYIFGIFPNLFLNLLNIF